MSHNLTHTSTSSVAHSSTHTSTPLVSIVETAFRQKRIFFWSSLATFLLAMLFIFGTHKKYSSEMVLLIQNARRNQPISTEPTAAVQLPSDVTEEQLNSQAQVLQSQDVLDEVVSPGWRDTPPQNRIE